MLICSYTCARIIFMVMYFLDRIDHWSALDSPETCCISHPRGMFDVDLLIHMRFCHSFRVFATSTHSTLHAFLPRFSLTSIMPH
jgi:hypothetical protein